MVSDTLCYNSEEISEVHPIVINWPELKKGGWDEVTPAADLCYLRVTSSGVSTSEGNGRVMDVLSPAELFARCTNHSKILFGVASQLGNGSCQPARGDKKNENLDSKWMASVHWRVLSRVSCFLQFTVVRLRLNTRSHGRHHFNELRHG
jgi:hypothetical protein